MAKTIYYKTALTGGTADALDSIDGALLAHDDVAFVLVAATNTSYVYRLDSGSGALEASPDVIAPDLNAGTKRWILCRGVV